MYVRDHVQEQISLACYEFPSAVHLLNPSLFMKGEGQTEENDRSAIHLTDNDNPQCQPWLTVILPYLA